MTAAWCQCRGVIERHPALSPDDATQILACPIKYQEPRVMWNWYTAAGAPVVFVEALAQESGLMLADYHQWLPGQKVAAKDFELPNMCVAPDRAGSPPAGSGKTLSNASCSDCHTTPW